MIDPKFDSPTYVFSIDDEDIIRDTNTNWVEFLPCFDRRRRSTPDRVVGTSLWDHITTPMAKLAYRKAIDQARDEKRPIVAKFTCDAPEICRELSIEFIAGEDNFVYCLTQVSDMPGTEDNPRPRECAWRDAPRTGAKCERCRFYKLEEAND